MVSEILSVNKFFGVSRSRSGSRIRVGRVEGIFSKGGIGRVRCLEYI